MTKGKCIGQGTFGQLVDMGIDFMSLLSNEEDPDSAIESDTEPPLEVRKRRFSQQMSCVGDEVKPRSRTFLRQESVFAEENRMQSELSIAGEVQQVEVYVCCYNYIVSLVILYANGAIFFFWLKYFPWLIKV